MNLSDFLVCSFLYLFGCKDLSVQIKKSKNFVLQVWALAVGKKTEMLATGGGDAVFNLWYDSTASDKEEAFRREVS